MFILQFNADEFGYFLAEQRSFGVWQLDYVAWQGARALQRYPTVAFVCFTENIKKQCCTQKTSKSRMPTDSGTMDAFGGAFIVVIIAIVVDSDVAATIPTYSAPLTPQSPSLTSLFSSLFL